MDTVHTYILHARECVRIYSGFSKRIPRLESPEGGTAHYQRSRAEVDRVRVHITPFPVLREMGALHITNAHEPELGRVRVHITPFSVLRERCVLGQGHI